MAWAWTRRGHGWVDLAETASDRPDVLARRDGPCGGPIAEVVESPVPVYSGQFVRAAPQPPDAVGVSAARDRS